MHKWIIEPGLGHTWLSAKAVCLAQAPGLVGMGVEQYVIEKEHQCQARLLSYRQSYHACRTE